MKFFLAFTSMMMSLSIFAQDIDCSSYNPKFYPNKSLDDIEKVLSRYEHVGRYPVVGKTTCRIKYSTKDYEAKIARKDKEAGSAKVSVESHGIKFKNESPELIKIFEKLTTKENFIVSDDEHNFTSKCDKVLCAVKEIFGDDVGPRILYIHQEYGLNASYLSFRDADNWQKDELDLMLWGLEDLPRGMLPLEDNRSFVKMQKGMTYKMYSGSGGCVGANAELRFFDCLWNNFGSDLNRMAVLAHEVAHFVGHKLNADNSSEWEDLSGWESEMSFENYDLKTEWNKSEDACFFSTYGQTNPAEDFAEAFVAYRYVADEYKKECPEKYQYLRDKVFNGIEFTKDKKYCEKRDQVKFELTRSQRIQMFLPF